MRLTLLIPILLVVCLILPAQAAWLATEGEFRSRITLYQKEEGVPEYTFKDAVDALVRDGKINTLHAIDFDRLPLCAGFQDEIAAELEKSAPHEWAAAKKSSGNVHNPRLDQLDAAFDKAVMSTPTVRNMNAVLAPYGLEVSKLSFEEMALATVGNDRRFRGILCLAVTPVPKPPAK